MEYTGLRTEEIIHLNNGGILVKRLSKLRGALSPSEWVGFVSEKMRESDAHIGTYHTREEASEALQKYLLGD